MKYLSIIFGITLFTTISLPAFAYLDPGAGSLIIQMAIAGIMGAIFTIKLYWYKFKAMLLKWLGRHIPSDDSEGQ